MAQKLTATTTYMTTEEAAAYLNMSHRTLESWRSKQRGPAYYKLGAFIDGRRSIGYLQEDLESWAKEIAVVKVTP